MTNPEKPRDSIGPIQTLSMDEFNLLVGKTNSAKADLPPVLLEFLRQYKVDVVSPADSPRPVTVCLHGTANLAGLGRGR